MTDLPPGWEWARLDEVAEVRLGRQRSPKNHTGKQMRPYLRAANVGWDGLRLDDVKMMNFTDDEVKIYRLEYDDIVVSEASGSPGEVGKPALWRGEIEGCCLQNTLIRVRSLGAVEPAYLLYFLRTEVLRGAFAEGTRGVGIHHIGRSRLAEWSIPIPPLLEQRRIITLLDDHLSRIDASESIFCAVAKRIAKMRDRYITVACTGGLASAAGLSASPPAYVGVQDGELPRLPGNWEWARLGEIADVVGGITKDAKRQADIELPEVPYLRVANVQRGRLDLNRVTLIRVPINKARQLRLQMGDVLLNEGGDRDKLGRGWIWEGQIPECIHQNHVFRARIRDNQLDPKLLAWHANTFGKRWCERNGKQSVNLASISLSKIRLLPVPVPPRKDQAALVALIEEHLAELDRLAEFLRRALRRSEYLRRSLLAGAFAGRLVLQDPNDELAPVLLERIKVERATKPKIGRVRRTRKNGNPEQGSIL